MKQVHILASQFNYLVHSFCSYYQFKNYEITLLIDVFPQDESVLSIIKNYNAKLVQMKPKFKYLKTISYTYQLFKLQTPDIVHIFPFNQDLTDTIISWAQRAKSQIFIHFDKYMEQFKQLILANSTQSIVPQYIVSSKELFNEFKKHVAIHTFIFDKYFNTMQKFTETENFLITESFLQQLEFLQPEKTQLGSRNLMSYNFTLEYNQNTPQQVMEIMQKYQINLPEELQQKIGIIIKENIQILQMKQKLQVIVNENQNQLNNLQEGEKNDEIGIIQKEIVETEEKKQQDISKLYENGLNYRICGSIFQVQNPKNPICIVAPFKSLDFASVFSHIVALDKFLDEHKVVSQVFICFCSEQNEYDSFKQLRKMINKYGITVQEAIAGKVGGLKNIFVNYMQLYLHEVQMLVSQFKLMWCFEQLGFSTIVRELGGLNITVETKQTTEFEISYQNPDEFGEALQLAMMELAEDKLGMPRQFDDEWKEISGDI